ncbi:S1 RNA-binding domain-containing protein [Streptomyces sp. NPDC048523]|uniref:S1 RNA-binding domain-containing protein n=1 Tax=unclassified Streptomyces TaxID=2593676 RepID=UPI0033267505
MRAGGATPHACTAPAPISPPLTSPAGRSFGVFVQVTDGIEGLVHLRELTSTPVESPPDVVQAGDAFTVVVTEIDGERRRLVLSRRQGSSDDRSPLHVAATVPSRSVPERLSARSGRGKHRSNPMDLPSEH